MKRALLFLLIALTALGSGACSGRRERGIPQDAPEDEVVQAQTALSDFLEALSAGEYERAAALYAGDYQTLRDWNPDLPPEDYAALLRNGCEINGLQCLPLRGVVQTEHLDAGYRFTVALRTAEGTAFATPDGRNTFDFTVLRLGGAFRVRDLPPYLP